MRKLTKLGICVAIPLFVVLSVLLVWLWTHAMCWCFMIPYNNRYLLGVFLSLVSARAIAQYIGKD